MMTIHGYLMIRGNMHYLVTGGGGFIGSHLSDRLLADGHSVTVLDDLSTGKKENISPQVRLVVASIADTGVFEPLLDGVDGVFHLAAIASVERSRQEWSHTNAVNQGGLVRLLEALARRPRGVPVVYASSAAVYGDNAHLPLAETAPAKPLTAYGADKLGCELHAHAGALVHGIPALGLRFFNVYGPRQDPESPYSGVVSIFMRRIPVGQPVTLYGDGSQTRDFIHVSDVVRALLAAMQTLCEGRALHDVCNVCTGRGVSLLELMAAIEKISGRKAEKHVAPARTGDIKHSRGDAGKLAALLGIKAQMALDNGLKTIMEAK